MLNLLIPIIDIIVFVLGLYELAIFIYVILGLLVNFDVVNSRNQLVRAVISTLGQIVEPGLSRIRRVLPMFGAVDISPLVLWILVELVRRELPALVLLLAR